MEMDRVIADAQSDHHWQPRRQSVCHRLGDVFLWQLFPDGLQSDVQLISRLGLRLEYTVRFEHVMPDGFKSGGFGALIFLNKPEIICVCSQSNAEKFGLSWLKQHNFVF